MCFIAFAPPGAASQEFKMDIEQLFAAAVRSAHSSDEISLALSDLWRYLPEKAHEISTRYVKWDKNDMPRRREDAFGENVVAIR
jgi:hypothetical protein